MKLEYDQCFYKYIEQKTKELFMSVNSVNGISQMQNAQGVSFGSSNQDDGSGPDIGKLLVGTVLVAAVAGVGIAGYKSGKTLTKEGDGVLTTFWNGIKSWFGKNGDDVAQVAKNDISAECKTSLKTLFSDGEISKTQKQDIVENADEISKVFSNKARNNATKADKLAEIAKIKDNTEKTNALADFFEVEKKLTIGDDGNIDITGLSLDDQAIIARKLKDPDGNLITGSIGDIIDGLQNKYSTKQLYYNFTSINLKNLINENTIIPAAAPSAAATEVNKIIAKRFNRAGAAQTLAKNCEDSLSYINTQKSLTKWLKAGDLTQDEYDNLRALAENQFMSTHSHKYRDYLLEGLIEKGKLHSLDSNDRATLNNKYSWLKLDDTTTSLTAADIVAKRKESATSISEYLGLNGAQIPPGWTIENNALHFKGSTPPSNINIGGIEINNFDSYKKMSEGNITGYTINLDNLKEIFKLPVTLTL